MEREHMSTNPTHRQHLLGKLLLLYFQGGGKIALFIIIEYHSFAYRLCAILLNLELLVRQFGFSFFKGDVHKILIYLKLPKIFF